MNTLIRLFTWALALAAPPGAWLTAADSFPTRAKGHVLVFPNERTIEGDIEREGEQFRVRRPSGETLVPAAGVAYLAENLEDAYAFLRLRANLRDADERIRLARWCQLHGLRAQALAEATAAVELRPRGASGQRLLQSLQRLPAEVKPDARPSPVVRAVAESPAPATLEVNAEEMGQFVNRVQPILMNACASCHMSRGAGHFRLTRASEAGLVNRRATQQNLGAVLEQINPERWEASPLLVKAVNVHGQATQPPLKNRQTTAFHYLEDWVRATVANNPSLPDRSGGVTPAAVERKAPGQFGAVKPEPTATGAPPERIPVPQEATPKAETPVDPFDPGIFNRQMHPAGR